MAPCPSAAIPPSLSRYAQQDFMFIPSCSAGFPNTKHIAPSTAFTELPLSAQISVVYVGVMRRRPRVKQEMTRRRQTRVTRIGGDLQRKGN